MSPAITDVAVSLTVNGRAVEASVPPRLSLADLLRDRLDLTGTHIGCEHGACGACTVSLGGEPVRSCICLAASCDGLEVVTVEGLHGPEVDALRAAFAAAHGVQCGFCTPGMLVTALDILRRDHAGSEEDVRHELSGNMCRCTGYVGIVRAVLAARERMAR